ncbi:MAG TPA: CPBP family intramembrane glutamic endopeptidase [Polyangiaceae bacterium]
MTTRERARRGLFVYFAFVLVFSGVCEGAMIAKGGLISAHPLLAVANMWVPGFACIFARVALKEGFGDVSFSIGEKHGSRMLAFGWLTPVLVGLVAYGLAWTLRLETFAAPPSPNPLVSSRPIFLRFAFSLLLNVSLGTIISAISAGGEELGWRGYMLTRLVDAEVPHPVVVSGLIWSAWHLPLIASGLYAAGPHPALSCVLFVASTTAGGMIAARARLESGSLWPAVAFHSAWNAVIQGTFDRFTLGGDEARTTTIWTGESGILVAAVSVVVALVMAWKAWPARRTPDEEPFAKLDRRTI